MQIRWHQMHEVRPAAARAAQRRLETLGASRADLIDVRIAGHQEGSHRRGGRAVHISALLRGQRLAASRQSDELELALSEALDAFEREVHELRRRRRERRTARLRLPPLLGVVERVFREGGYGFVLTDDGTEVYFHRNAVRGGLDFGALEEGRRVGLDIEPGDKGPQAIVLTAVPPGTPSP